jgi:hypothetical protein
MKGYRFYAAMPEARKSKSANKRQFAWTVAALKRECEAGYQNFRADLIAVILDENGNPMYSPGPGLNCDAFATAIEGNPLSYCVTSVSREYLAKRATRVPEALARALSPELFTRLEN